MSNKGIKHDIEENWKKAKNFTPRKDEVIIYEPDPFNQYYRVKIGDGVTNVNDLLFVTADEYQWQTF